MEMGDDGMSEGDGRVSVEEMERVRTGEAGQPYFHESVKLVLSEELAALRGELLNAVEEASRTMKAAVADARVGFDEEVRVLRDELVCGIIARLGAVEGTVAEFTGSIADVRAIAGALQLSLDEYKLDANERITAAHYAAVAAMRRLLLELGLGA